jgi:hypothetical protein
MARKPAQRKESHRMSQWLAVGISLGLIFGILLSNIAIGVAIGTALGFGIGASAGVRGKKKLTIENRKPLLVAAIVIAIALAVALAVVFVSSNQAASPSEGCTITGGVLVNSLCCKSSGSFPNNCLIGACGCSPSNSHVVITCQCPQGKCFNGKVCI